LLFHVPDIRLVELSDPLVASVLLRTVAVADFRAIIIRRGVGGDVLAEKEAVVVLQCLR
jgi:hypothetical protein